MIWFSLHAINAFCVRRGSAPIPPCYCLVSRRSIPVGWICCLNASFLPNAMNHPTLILISNTSGAKKSSSIFTRNTGATRRYCGNRHHHRSRSAVREAVKAMGLSGDVASASGAELGGGNRPPPPEHIREAGLDPETPVLAVTLDMAAELIGFHGICHSVGGFIITNERLDKMVPIGNAAMAERTSSNGTRMI